MKLIPEGAFCGAACGCDEAQSSVPALTQAWQVIISVRNRFLGAVGAFDSAHATTNSTTADKAPVSISRKVRSIVDLKR